MYFGYFRSFTVYLLLTAVFAACLFTSKTLAATPSDILVNMVPENPAPYENVDIALSSYAVNLDTVQISWLVDNKNILSGIGKKFLSLKSGSVDTENNVLVKINLPEGEIQLRILIKPSNMVLLWQATDSHVPPFYKGKALPSPDSEIKVVAMPEIKKGGVMADPNNMTYDWKLDDNNNVGASGYGKNFFIYNNDYLESSNNIGVVASTTDQKYSTGNNITIGTTNPRIVFYKKDPIYGTLWEKALIGSHKIESDETLEAVPYFVSPRNPSNPILKWSWTINDSPVYLPSVIKNLIPLKKDPNLSGVAKLRVQIENNYKIFQTTNQEINLEF